MEKPEGKTRDQILEAALKLFADRGYAATAVQDIVDAVKVTKPALYYYFDNKAELYQALVDSAHDERFRLMQAAAERGATVAEKLVGILTALFEFLQKNRELMRIAFATAFVPTVPPAPPGRFSMITGCPRDADSRSASGRA